MSISFKIRTLFNPKKNISFFPNNFSSLIQSRHKSFSRTNMNVLIFSSIDGVSGNIQTLLRQKLPSFLPFPKLTFLHPHSHKLEASEFQKQIQEAEIIVGEPPDLALQIENFHNGTVKWIQSSYAGVDVLVAAWKNSSKKRSFHLTRLAGVFGKLMSEYVLAYILSQERQIFIYKKQQEEKVWKKTFPRKLSSIVVGLLGTGNIGSVVAKSLSQMEMKVIGYKRNSIPSKIEGIEEIYSGMNELPKFLSQCDYLISILPQTPETIGFLSDNVLSSCKPSCIFINVGRGSVIDESSLVNALEKKWIATAILDVFQKEPLPETSVLWNMPNVIITPHVSALSYPEDVASVFVNNYIQYCSNQPLNFEVDWEKGY